MRILHLNKGALRRGLAVALPCTLSLLLTLASAADTDRKNDPLNDKLDAVSDQIPEDPVGRR